MSKSSKAAPQPSLHLFSVVACLAGLATGCLTPDEETPVRPENPQYVSVTSVGGTVAGDKTVAPSDIACGGLATVTLSLTGQVSVAENPVDVMLVLDRSGSMGGTPLANLKAAANQFVDLIEDTNANLPPEVTVRSRIGVVSFASTASLDQGLTSDLGGVRTAVNGLGAGGLTAIGDGINLARAELLASEPARPKLMIVVTDGVNNAGADPVAAANVAKVAGAEIFVLGFGGVDADQLASIASLPLADHLFVAPDSSTLAAAFAALGAAIVQPAGTDIVVVDTVHGNFSISNAVATLGVVNVAGNVLTWTIDELGSETATLTYDVEHIDTTSGGILEVNTSVVYTDAEGKTVDFPSPAVAVRGCAANLELTPATSTNTVGDPHPVTALVTDDFGDPVGNIDVIFQVTTSPSAATGEPGNPQPAAGAGTTDAAGEATFVFTNNRASSDIITATVPVGQPNVSVELVANAAKTWLPIEVPVDLRPTSCPNPLNTKAQGVLPAAVLGTPDFDATAVNPASVRLEGVSPLQWAIEDVATPYEPFVGKVGALDCTTAGADGHLDLTLKFHSPSVVAALGAVVDGAVMVLRLTGEFLDGGVAYDFVGEDVVRILKK